MDNQAALSRTILIQMARTGITQAQLAHKAGIGEARLSRHINNYRDWTIPLLDVLAQPLGLHDAFGIVEATQKERTLVSSINTQHRFLTA
ncbi:helix-turn-helix domain-containing protein [Bifidobacterium aquikefiri]|uniref:helix-turn-helix domain-containing protein n=1 Tax=Bifidobacterium aquikefiri TaxID=1653207 RepID=UPI0023F394F0|nr:helix-turn-helix transcriptional regulator [Bifidobacterium aquikefiri]